VKNWFQSLPFKCNLQRYTAAVPAAALTSPHPAEQRRRERRGWRLGIGERGGLKEQALRRAGHGGGGGVSVRVSHRGGGGAR
jgi:hypothetical protein